MNAAPRVTNIADDIARALSIASGVPQEQLRVPADGAAAWDEQLRAICSASGIVVRPVHLAADWQRGGSETLLARIDGRTIVLRPNGNGYHVIDARGLAGRRRLDARAVATLEQPVFALVPTLAAEESTPAAAARMFGPILRGDIVRIAALMLVSGGLGAAVPAVIGLIVGVVIPAALANPILAAIVGMIAAAIVSGGLTITARLVAIRLDARVGATANTALLARLLMLPAAFFRRYGFGELATRLYHVGRVRTIVVRAVLALITALPNALGSFVIVLVLDPVSALLGIGAAAVVLAARIGAALYTLRVSRDLARRTATAQILLQQIVGGIGKIQAANAVSAAFLRWRTTFAATQELTFRNVIAGHRSAIVAALVAPATTGILAVVVTVHGTRNPADWLAVVAGLGALLAACDEAGTALLTIARALPALERVGPILSAAPEDRSHARPSRLLGAVELDGISFGYPGQTPILRNVHVRVEPGEFVAIVGRSGAGKSTLVRLLLGFEAPSLGAVRYDGHDLATLDIRSVRRQIGCVLQDDRTIPGSIYENITCGLAVPHARVWDALERVGLRREVEALPMRLETHLGDQVALSGGQRQRLIIARALLHEPRIVIFDEATSALDTIGQAVVTDALSDVGVTRIVIAHRLTTIQRADRIAVLADGEIVEAGTYTELLQRDGAFAAFARRQHIQQAPV